MINKNFLHFTFSFLYIIILFFFEDYVGLSSILFLSLLVALTANLYPSISNVLFIAFGLRLIVIFIGNYIIVLPDNSSDVIFFLEYAVEWSEGGFVNLFSHDNFPGISSLFISWFIAIFYSLFGQSLILAQTLSLFFGLGSVFMGWLVAIELWDKRIAIKIAWVLALFPSFILYSCLVLREAYILFFLLLALYGVVKWARTGKIKPIFIATLGFIGATLFHSAMAVGGLFFLTIVSFSHLINFFKSFFKGRLHLKSMAFLLIFALSIIFFFPRNDSGDFYLTKFGTFKDAINLNRLIYMTEKNSVGVASYPEILQFKSATLTELISKTPLRYLYYTFSPFPWDIKKPIHLIGMFDGIMHMVIFFLVFRNLKVILADRALRIILIIFAVYFLIFGFIVANFGTAIRHRGKFVIMLILLIAPKIPKLFLKKKNKLKESKALNNQPYSIERSK